MKKSNEPARWNAPHFNNLLTMGLLKFDMSSMIRFIILAFCCIPLATRAQNDILVLEKHGKHVRSYAIGDMMDVETVYKQRFQGIITDLRHDSIFLNDRAWHYKEIAVIHDTRGKSGYMLFGTAMLVASGGILVLNAVNGAYRGDEFKDWYTQSALITAAALAVGGILLRRAYYVHYHLGKKFKLQYLQLNPNKK
jgi:hypothetical protein